MCCTNQNIELEVYPYAPCREYLSTFTPKIAQMYVNMPYMEDLGYVYIPFDPSPSSHDEARDHVSFEDVFLTIVTGLYNHIINRTQHVWDLDWRHNSKNEGL